MATIDSKKLLPAGKPGGSIVESQKPLLIPVNNVIFKKDVKISQKFLKPVDQERESGGSLVVIKKKVLKISDVIKNTYLIEQSENNRKRKERERQKAEEREKQLETRKPTKINENNIAKVAIPGKSILDTINRFIGFTLLGYLFNKYNQFLPKLIEFTKLITPVAKFVESFGKNVINGVINFIDAGYQAYDKVRDEIKNIGGEGAQKTFDEFSKNLNLILNGAIMASMLIASTAPGKKSGGVSRGGGYGAGYTAGYAAGIASRGRGPRYRSPGQAAAGGTFQENLSRQALSRERMLADVGPRGPLDKMRRGFRGAGAQLQTGTLFKRGAGLQKALYNAPGKLKGTTSSLGKVGSVGGKIFGRIPIIGGLIDFAINLAMGEDPGRAAAKAVGSTVGAALGTFIPVPFAGTILGGILGDIVGGAMYDTLVGDKKKPEARAQGGQVSGGQSRVAASRRIKTRKKIKVKRIQPQKTQPGRDVGGKKKIEELYGVDEPGQRSALRVLKDSSADVKRMKVLRGLPGAMFGAGIDLALGQKPDKKLSRDLGNIFGSVIQAAVDTELDSSFNDISKTIAMANGGVVPSREIKSNMSLGEKVGKRIATALAISIEGAASSVLNNLNRELRMEGGAPGSLPGLSGGAQYQLGGGAGGSQELREEVAKAAQQLGVPAPDLLGVILAESGGDPSITNRWGCTGLIQFCPGTGQVTVGKTGAQLRRMSIKEQMPYVVKYLKAAGVKPGMSGYDLYSAIHAGHPGGNVVDAAGVSTRGYYNSRVKGLIETARANSQVISQSGPEAMVTGGIVPSQIPTTSGQGWRWGKMHKGIDLDGGDGAPISSAQDAKVVWSGDKGDGYGYSVILRYSNGAETRFGHLKSTNVRQGQSIKAGQMIGRQGNTGASKGSHLHFEYYPNGGAMTYEGYGNAAAVKDSYFRYGGNVKPKIASKPMDEAGNIPGKDGITLQKKPTPKGEPHLVNGKMYYVDLKNNTIKDANGNIIDVSNGKNRWLLKGISEQRNAQQFKPPTLGPQSSILPTKPTIPDVATNTSYSQNGMVAFENNTILYQKEFVLT